MILQIISSQRSPENAARECGPIVPGNDDARPIYLGFRSKDETAGAPRRSRRESASATTHSAAYR